MALNKLALLIFIHTFLVTACSKNNPVPNDSDVFAWGHSTLHLTLSQTDKISPDFFDLALIPHDYDYSKGKYDSPPTDEKVNSLNAQFLSHVGIVSSLADYCSLDWNDQNFLPMMQWQRSRPPKQKRNGQLISRIGFAHGYAMGTTDELLKVWQPNCDQLTSDLDGQFFSEKFPTCKEKHCGA